MLLTVKQRGLTLDQPDSGRTSMSKLMGDSVSILAIGDSIANVNQTIATRRAAVDVFDVFPHDPPSLLITWVALDLPSPSWRLEGLGELV